MLYVYLFSFPPRIKTEARERGGLPFVDTTYMVMTSSSKWLPLCDDPPSSPTVGKCSWGSSCRFLLECQGRSS